MAPRWVSRWFRPGPHRTKHNPPDQVPQWTYRYEIWLKALPGIHKALDLASTHLDAKQIRHMEISLQWCYNEPGGVSNHQPHNCLLNRYSSTDQRKDQSSALLAFLRGIHRWSLNSPYKGPVTRIFFHLMTSSCYPRVVDLAMLQVNWTMPVE